MAIGNGWGIGKDGSRLLEKVPPDAPPAERRPSQETAPIVIAAPAGGWTWKVISIIGMLLSGTFAAAYFFGGSEERSKAAPAAVDAVKAQLAEHKLVDEKAHDATRARVTVAEAALVQTKVDTTTLTGAVLTLNETLKRVDSNQARMESRLDRYEQTNSDEHNRMWGNIKRGPR